MNTIISTDLNQTTKAITQPLDPLLDLQYLTSTVPLDEEDLSDYSPRDKFKSNINDTLLSQSSMRRNSQQSNCQPEVQTTNATPKKGQRVSKIKDVNELSLANKRTKSAATRPTVTQTSI